MLWVLITGSIHNINTPTINKLVSFAQKFVVSTTTTTKIQIIIKKKAALSNCIDQRSFKQTNRQLLTQICPRKQLQLSTQQQPKTCHNIYFHVRHNTLLIPSYCIH